ncbi:MAG: ABC transporter [Actinobacteria bacterium HGW-Actinobacteria-1]|jgi:predicted unusual protein kinase regulating ubiquinone biosynthesis (AarF/ABC1/UbiB family)|nr:MAG: ABC transporter [Actinobacteria bacterium HGW-Actinobacteria-1]
MKASQLRARYWRIVFFFGRVTLGFIFWEIVARRIGLGGVARRNRSERSRQTAVRFRALAIRMGGLMIKVGQFLSARLDVLPPEITDELAGLQDEVPAESFEAIRALAEAELGSPLSEHYASFDENPLAAASLGQAHRACLRESDAAEMGFAEVVVKVQRPHIEQVIEVDLSALRRVGRWLQRYRPIADRVDVSALLEEFATTTRAEVDYLAEASNAEAFAENFADDPRVHVPRVAWELTTRRVLTLEDVSAIKLGDYEAISAAGIDRSQVAKVLVDTYMQQIFEDGFFHADPHPGNLFVTPLEGTDAEGHRNWQLTFVDFGMVGRVPENLRSGLREAVIAVGLQDGARLVKAFKTLGVLLPSADLKLIEMASIQVFERFGGMSMGELREIDHAEMMRFGLQFRELMLNLPFQLPENLLLLGRSIAVLSGMCSGLDPEFNLWGSMAPYATKLVSDEGGSTWDTILAEGTKIVQTLIGLPARADRVLTTIERGELNVQTPMLELRIRRLERSVSRITGALVFSALLIAGAILYSTDPGLGTGMMGASAVPLAWALLSGRRGHPGRR